MFKMIYEIGFGVNEAFFLIGKTVNSPNGALT